MTAITAALDGPQDCVEEMRQAYLERRDFMVPALNSIDGIECANIEGAFYLFPNPRKRRWAAWILPAACSTQVAGNTGDCVWLPVAKATCALDCHCTGTTQTRTRQFGAGSTDIVSLSRFSSTGRRTVFVIRRLLCYIVNKSLTADGTTMSVDFDWHIEEEDGLALPCPMGSRSAVCRGLVRVVAGSDDGRRWHSCCVSIAPERDALRAEVQETFDLSNKQF